MTQSALDVRDLTLRFGAVTALDGVTFAVPDGEIFAVIGPNGAGKSSLFNVVTRLYQPTSGTVAMHGEDLLSLRARDLPSRGLTRSFQNLGLCPDLTVLVNVMLGRHHRMSPGALAAGLSLLGSRRQERAARAAAVGALNDRRHRQPDRRRSPRAVLLAHRHRPDPPGDAAEHGVLGVHAGTQSHWGQRPVLGRLLRPEAHPTQRVVPGGGQVRRAPAHSGSPTR